MLFRASERLNLTRTPAERAQGAALALLVQVSFLLMLLLSRPVTPRHTLAHETILLLRSSPKVTSQTIDARGAVQRRIAPVQVPLLPNLAPPVLAPPSGIAGFGRALLGCAPEHYAELPPDEKAHCPKPGEGLAAGQPPDLLHAPKSHSKDETMWQEQWAEDHWVPALCSPTNGTPIVACVLDQAIAENRRQQAAWDRIANSALRPSSPSRRLCRSRSATMANKVRT